MANVLDEVTLRFLGMELCGRYGIGHDGKLFLRPQSCTPTELEETARAMTGVRGRKRAGEVAPFVAGGSASPMETALFLILCAAREEGGFGLPWPELNHSIPLTGAARDLWDDDFITPDLLWEAAKLILEYDSGLHHTASHRIARDARRRNVFEEMGYRVVTVTTEHMRTPQELQRIASIVARSTGTELETPTDEQWTQMVSWQLLVRGFAENPDRLLGPEQTAPNKRTWHSRRPHEASSSK